MEEFFWTFCDDYIELVKTRAYSTGPAADSANRTLRIALDTQLRLLAPFLPFAAEEVWSWFSKGSVHRAPWPTAETTGADPAVLTATAEVLAEIRKAKSTAKVTMKTPVTDLVVTDSEERLALVRKGSVDLVNAGVVQEMQLIEGAAGIEITLGDPPPKPPKT